MIKSGISCNLDRDLLVAAYPLFQSEEIECVEWSFDTVHNDALPHWYEELLQSFAEEDALLIHGVYFSLFSAKMSKEQLQWLNSIKEISNQYNFTHLTEHFGLMTGKDFHKGAPLDVPHHTRFLDIGIDRIRRMASATERPVGLENLAFAYNKEQVKRQGEFISELLEPVNGFMILDLHNIYCQMHNFNISAQEILKLYPLDRVREVHISGGSWYSLDDNSRIRRDTHDDAVPEEVFDLLKLSLHLCPNLSFVILEQMGTALKNLAEQEQYRFDFLRMKAIVAEYDDSSNINKVLNNFKAAPYSLEHPVEDNELYQQQIRLSGILENASSLADAKLEIQKTLDEDIWKYDEWNDVMIITALDIAQKWSKGFIR